MQRIWRSKPTPELISIMEESVDVRLYLIQEKGPLSFVFQDEDKKKFNINIGDNINCTCGGGKKEHCIHTIYVLNRIFKIQFNEPLIFQLSYSDGEISKILDTRKREDNVKKKIDAQGLVQEVLMEGNRMNLFDDVTCAICQEDMYTFQGLYYCTNSCGHNFHTHCLKVWSEHKRSVSDTISCPMCRSVWQEDEFKKAIMIKSKHYTHIKSHKVNCKSCDRVNIKGERFHCLYCEGFDMCVECFALNKHTQHPLVYKKSVDDKWLGIDLINSTDKYNLKYMRLSQYLTGLLSDYDENRNNIYEKSCFVCKSDRASSLHLLRFKELPVCKHLIHFKCCENVFKLKECKNNYIIDVGFNLCKYDNSEIFIGLKSLNFLIAEEEKKQDERTMYTAQEGLFIRKYGKNKMLHDRMPRKRLISPMSRPVAHKADFNFALNIEKLDFNNNIYGYEKEVTNEAKLKTSKTRPHLMKIIPKKVSSELPSIQTGIKAIGFKQLTLKVILC
jgi:hypothetical protein